MDDTLWRYQDKYMNLLKPLSAIGTEFMEQLSVQQEVLELVRRFGIYRTLTLISIRGAMHHTIRNDLKEML